MRFRVTGFSIPSLSIAIFTRLVGEQNRIHISKHAAEFYQFSHLVVPGVQILGYVSAAISMAFSSGTLARRGTFDALLPVYEGQIIDVEFEVSNIKLGTAMLPFKVFYGGTPLVLALAGEITVMIPKEEYPHERGIP